MAFIPVFKKTGLSAISEEEHREVVPGVSVELGKNEGLLGIEILDASKVLGATMDLKKLLQKLYQTIQHLSSTKSAKNY